MPENTLCTGEKRYSPPQPNTAYFSPVNSEETSFTGFVDSALLIKDGSGGWVLKLAGWILAREDRTEGLLVSLPTGIGVYAELVDRPDVAQKIPHIPHALHSGFATSIPVLDAQNEYTLDFRVRLISGREILSQLQVRPEVAGERGISSQRRDKRDTGGGLLVRDENHEGLSARESLLSTLDIKLKSFLRSKVNWSFIPEPPVSLSIIIPVHNQAHLTFGCLEAIRSQLTNDMEVILVDNGSTDATRELLQRTRGIISILNEANQSFSSACNQGAQVASGSILLFLNNDAFLLPGALEAAVSTLNSFHGIGALGAKLIYPDGKVQEVGSLLLPNGTAVGRGRGGRPESDSLSHAAVVDFVSAAFLMIRREHFEQVGGFDTRYEPAYYEDVDLCIRLGEIGLFSVVEPRVEVLHVERGSAMQSASVDNLIAKNCDLFRSLRGNDFLARLLPNHSSRVTELNTTRTILIMDDALPHPAAGQGQGRASQILGVVRRSKCKILFYPAHGNTSEESRSLYPDVTIVNPRPFEAELPFLRRMLEEADLLIVSRPHHMEQVQLAKRVLPPPAFIPPIIYDAEALQAKRDIIRLEVLDEISFSDQEIIEVVCHELGVARDADLIFTSSSLEAATFIDFEFPTPAIVGYGVNVSPTTLEFSLRKDFVTVGPMKSVDTPNSDGLIWFVTQVMPHIVSLLPDPKAALHAVGRCDVDVIAELQGPTFKLLGRMADLTPVYSRHRVFVAPTRFAAGIPIKVIEAAAHGIPCVVSPVIATQLGWRDEEEVLVGYSAEDFGAKCAALYVNEDLWMSLRDKALARVREQFAPENFERVVRESVSRFIPDAFLPNDY